MDRIVADSATSATPLHHPHLHGHIICNLCVLKVTISIRAYEKDIWDYWGAAGGKSAESVKKIVVVAIQLWKAGC